MASLIVVYKEKDEIGVNQLRKLLETKDDTEDGIVGVEDRTVKVVPWLEKVWLQNKATGKLDSKVLLIDDIKGAKSLLPVIDVKYSKHGITYGWAGNQAIISIEEKALIKKEDYEAFLADFETITDNIGSEYGKKMSEYSKNILKDAWLATLPMVGVYFSGKLVGDALKRIREPMLMFAITHIYLNHLDAFIKE